MVPSVGLLFHFYRVSLYLPTVTTTLSWQGPGHLYRPDITWRLGDMLVNTY